MADTKNTITISFKAVNAPQLQKAIESLDKATKSLINSQVKLAKEGKKVINGQEKLNKSTKKTSKGFFDLGHSARNGTDKLNGLGGAFSVLRSKLLLFNFAMAMGIRQIIQFTKESNKVKSMETAFNTLSGSVELSSTALKKLQEATGNTMSEFELFQQANNAMILGVSKNSDEMAEMFKIAKTLGRALGRDTASSVESLITGIGRQSRLMLDNIGIIVKADEAYEAYADELGTTADKLSDAEKKQAFLNATMESARQKVATIGTSTIPTAQDSFEKFSTATSNLSRAIGESLSPTMSDLASSSTTVLENLTELLDLTRKNTSAEMEFAVAQDLAELAIKKYGKSVSIVFDENKPLLSQLKDIRDSMRIGGRQTETFGMSFVTIVERIKELEEAQARYNAVTADQKAAQARRDELTEIEKAKEAIRKKQEAQQKEFDENTKKQAERAFQAEMARKKQEQLSEREKQEHKEMLEAKTRENDAYYNGLKMARDKSSDELKEMLDKELMQYDAYYEGIKMARENLDKELSQMQDEMQKQNKEHINNINNSLSAFDGVLSSWRMHMRARLDEELSTLKDSEAYREADTEKRKDLEREVTKGYKQEQTAQFRIGQATALADIAMSTSSAVMKSVAGSWVTIGEPWKSLITALGVVQAGLVLSQKPPSFETGGIVGGRRHSQGGTLIEAEQGEFVMSRNAVQTIGVEALNQMNQGGGAGLTINVSAPLVDETVLDTIIPAIEKAQRMNLA